MIECPHCKSSVDDSCAGRTCSQCGEHIYTKDFLQKVVDSRIRVLRRSDSYEQIVKHILDGNFDAATEKIRSVIGRKDISAEPVMIDKIINGPEILRRPASVSTNTSTIQESPQSASVKLMPCLACGSTISQHAESCPHGGQPTGVHICPRCNSTNTKTISGVSKATSIFLWGPFAANKVVSKFECKHCGHKW